MCTVIIALIGCVTGLLWLWMGQKIKLNRTATLAVFAVAWLGLCGWNMALGVSHGYSVMEELPFLLANFLVTLIAVVVLSKKLGGYRGF